MKNEQVRLIPIGGTTNVNKNMYVYETENEILIVDCGIGFPDADMYGVDIVIPDFSYVIERSEKVIGILLTHGHEDHIGAVPYLLSHINVPVYGTKLVLGFLREKFKEHNINKSILKTIDPDQPNFKIGSFDVTPFRVNHSVPDSLAYGLKVNGNLIIHVSDFKFDWSPVMDKPFEVGKLAKLADEHPTLLLSDSLGSSVSGYTRSERVLGETFLMAMEKNEGKQIIVTTVSSNISRIQQVIDSAIKHRRKVVLLGRSIKTNIEVAQTLGYLNAPLTVFIDEKDLNKFKDEDLVYITTGAYGQTESALGRIASNTHKNIKLQNDAIVIFSADPIPGSFNQIDAMIDKLTLLGAEVWYKDIQENLHVSGHGASGDITMLAAIAKPKYFMPIGGTVKTMRAYTKLVSQLGHSEENFFELNEGQSLIIENGSVKLGDIFKTGNVFIDGNKQRSLDPLVIKDRQQLADEGIVAIAIPFNIKTQKIVGNIEINSRGFVYMKESKGLIHNAIQKVEKVITTNSAKLSDWNYIKQEVDKELGKFFYKETGRTPIILPIIVEV